MLDPEPPPQPFKQKRTPPKTITIRRPRERRRRNGKRQSPANETAATRVRDDFPIEADCVCEVETERTAVPPTDKDMFAGAKEQEE